MCDFSLEVYGSGRIANALLRFLYGYRGVEQICFQVRNIGFEFADGLLLLRSLRLSGIGFPGCVSRDRLGLLHCLILAPQCIAQFLDLLLLLCQGCLLRRNRVLQRLHVRGCNRGGLGPFWFRLRFSLRYH